jgi:hypothetical protein
LHNLVEVEAHQDKVESLRWQLMQSAAQVGDLIRDYICKIFGSGSTSLDSRMPRPLSLSPRLQEKNDE